MWAGQDDTQRFKTRFVQQVFIDESLSIEIEFFYSFLTHALTNLVQNLANVKPFSSCSLARSSDNRFDDLSSLSDDQNCSSVDVIKSFRLSRIERVGMERELNGWRGVTCPRLLLFSHVLSLSLSLSLSFSLSLSLILLYRSKCPFEIRLRFNFAVAFLVW